MKIREYAEKNHVDPEVLYAGELLEKYGELFSIDFQVHNAIPKAAEMLCVSLDEDLGNWRDIRGWNRENGQWSELT